MLKSSLLATAFMAGALVAASGNALAQPLVGAGGQIQQIPPPPLQQKTIPDIRIDGANAARDTGPAGPRVLVKSLHVTGETLFPEAALVAAAGFKPGSQMDLRDLRDMAARISRYYNRRGYVVAQAYLPAQDIQDGAVTIAVVEGRYGKIGLRNRTRLSDRRARDILAGLDSGSPVAIAPLERRLLLLSDTPGVQVRSTLSPGAVVGTSDLTVDLTRGPLVSGSIDADNAGDPYTGAYRLGATVNLNDPTGHGDLLSLRVMSSFDGLNYGRLSYQTQIQAATVGVAYSALNYRLGGPFSSLQASGTAEIASIFASYPLIRSYDNNLTALVNLDDRTFQDKIGSTSSITDKTAVVLTAGFSGDHRDRFAGGGSMQYGLAWSFGNLDIRTPAARIDDAAGARSNGQYGKLTYSVSRQQAVAGPLSLFAGIRGQVASKNLDISEKMELGGAYAVRAYPEAQIYGDEGYVATLEARLLLPSPTSVPGRVQLIGFVDTGSASANKSPWFAGPNRETVSGTGVGAIWAANNNFVAKVTYAHTLGAADGVPGPFAPSRVWVQLVKFF